MRTRRYSFKASGTVQEPERAAALMKDNMNKGPESVVQHLYGKNAIQDDRDSVDKIELIMNNGQLSAVEVSAYDWFQKDRKDEVRECVQMAADRAGRETGSQISIDGNMKFLTTDENLPEHFYHITERKSLDNIMKNGLMPQRGHNDYRSKKRCTYLTEAAYIATWMSILNYAQDPVILEVETAKLPSVEQGRVWRDRKYPVGGVYSEHRTTDSIPPDALRIMSPEEVASLGVNEKAITQLMSVAAMEPDTWIKGLSEPIREEEGEVQCCMDRLKEMGVMDETTYKNAMKAYNDKVEAMYYESFNKSVGAIKEPPSETDDVPF